MSNKRHIKQEAVKETSRPVQISDSLWNLISFQQNVN